MADDDIRPPIPASLAHRPVRGGLVSAWWREIPLNGANANGRVALIDDADFELIAGHSWRVDERDRPGRATGPYAVTTFRVNGRQRAFHMHKLITGWPQTDHANHNGLDNRRSNLRPATGSQNMANQRARLGCRSSYKGVGWDANNGKWRVSVTKDRVTRKVGRFLDEIDAARAYDAVAREVFGEFACVNFPDLQPLTAGEIDRLLAASRRKGTAARGSAAGMAKLTEDQVREIRRRSAGGEMGKSLAASFGVGASVISRIVTNQGWLHVK